MTTELRKALDTIMSPDFGKGSTLHPLDVDAAAMLSLDVRALSNRARRLGLPSAATTLEFVADAISDQYPR